jgi:hypothetical protein
VIYLKWKLSAGTSGTGPEGPIDEAGGHADAGWAVDAAGYRIGYASDDADLRGGPWQVTEQTEAQALTFCQALYADAEVLPDGRISGPPPDDDV